MDTPRSRAWLRQLPNAITVLRLLLVPVIAALLLERHYAAAFATLLASAVSDFADGQIARRFDARTRFGAVADPLADKLTMLTVALIAAAQTLVPWWLAAAIVLRDLMIVGGALAYHRRVGPVEMAPTRLSKLNTVLEFVTLAAVLGDAAGLLSLQAVEPALFVLVLLTVLASGAQYLWVWGRRARGARAN
jgi:cardiolipin synthase